MVVLKALWKHGPSTAREIHSRAAVSRRCWAYTTVLTLLQRLGAKGYVASDKQGAAHVFRAAVSRDRLIRRRLRELTRTVCNGEATPLVLALVQNHRFTSEEIEAFRRLLDRLDSRREGG
jgi:predicted transcriptional regulator